MTELGLFEEPERVDWDALSGTATTVAVAWGTECCIIHGSAPGEVAMVMVELIGRAGQHKHDGPCMTIPISALAVTNPATLRRPLGF